MLLTSTDRGIRVKAMFCALLFPSSRTIFVSAYVNIGFDPLEKLVRAN